MSLFNIRYNPNKEQEERFEKATDIAARAIIENEKKDKIIVEQQALISKLTEALNESNIAMKKANSELLEEINEINSKLIN